MSPVDSEKYALYLGVMAVMAVTPGPANLFAVATGMERGPRAALIGVAGMNAAMLIWYAAAGLGLIALVAAFPRVFEAVALIGGLYVGWLGAKALRAAWTAAPVKLDVARPAALGAAFRDGFAVQLANPKAALFFTVVLPPFLDPARPMLAQLAAFAVATLAMDGAAMSAYGLAGGALQQRLREPNIRRGFSALVGALLVFAAILIVLRARH